MRRFSYFGLGLGLCLGLCLCLCLMVLFALVACAQLQRNIEPASPPTASEMGLGAPPTPDAVERWLEVDLASQVVRLREGENVIATYPVATGLGDSPSTLTYTGTFTVHNKIKAATFLPEFGVYVTDWVGFDQDHAIGFHSLPQDRYGQVVDSRLGIPISHGCVRVGNAAAVYSFAQIGMRVLVH